MHHNQASAFSAGEQKTVRVLIVEDDALVAWDTAQSLEDAGIEVAGVVSSGTAALEQLDAAKPDVVLMDVHIEGDLDGVETARMMRARGASPAIIFVTGFGDPDTAARIRAVKPEGYLQKPIMPDQLVCAVILAVRPGAD